MIMTTHQGAIQHSEGDIPLDIVHTAPESYPSDEISLKSVADRVKKVATVKILNMGHEGEMKYPSGLQLILIYAAIAVALFVAGMVSSTAGRIENFPLTRT
jgi:hypothetical protein